MHLTIDNIIRDLYPMAKNLAGRRSDTLIFSSPLNFFYLFPKKCFKKKTGQANANYYRIQIFLYLRI